MRFRILSDLHFEVDDAWEYQWRGEDAVMCSGDVSNWPRRHLAEGFFSSIPVPVFACLGNHDFYRGSVSEVVEWYSSLELQIPNLRFLHNRAEDIDDIRILGTPLWTDFSLDGAPEVAMNAARRGINDFNLTYGAAGKHTLLTPEDVAEMHVHARTFIESELIASNRPTIVLTHWSPSGRTMDAAYDGDPLNAYFHARADHLLREPIKLWIHGHSHHYYDEGICGVRVVRNPRGYAEVFEIPMKHFSSAVRMLLLTELDSVRSSHIDDIVERTEFRTYLADGESEKPKN